MRVADEFDVQVAIHTDTINEAGFVEDTIRAIAGRTIHTYHTEGAGGGHAPDIIRRVRGFEFGDSLQIHRGVLPNRRVRVAAELIFVESGGDNLAAALSPELVDTSIYVIDVAGGDKIPRKGGTGIRRSGRRFSEYPAVWRSRHKTSFGDRSEIRMGAGRIPC